MQRMLRILEKDMGTGARLVEIQETQIQRRACLIRGWWQAMTGGEGEAFCRLREKDPDPCHQQRARQPVDNRVQQRVQVGLRVEVSSEVNQGLPVVVPLAVEDAIHAVLDHALDGVEEL